jgi:hypothetical protein
MNKDINLRGGRCRHPRASAFNATINKTRERILFSLAGAAPQSIISYSCSFILILAPEYYLSAML